MYPLDYGKVGNLSELMNFLARIPKETVAERKKYFAQVTQDKDDAIANDPLKDQHPSMPISKERSTRVSFGGKRNT